MAVAVVSRVAEGSVMYVKLDVVSSLFIGDERI